MQACRCLLLLCLLQGVLGEDHLHILLKPTKRCVASDIRKGPCHVCSCTTTGVYHCLSVKCNDRDRNSFKEKAQLSSSKECEPDYTYRQDRNICSCNSLGHWTTTSCKKLFYRIRSYTKPITYKIGTNVHCVAGNYYIIGCNVCICGESGYIHFYSCTRRPCPHIYKDEKCELGDVIRTNTELCFCSEANYFIDRRCIEVKDEIIQNIQKEDLSAVVEYGKDWDDLNPKCKPYYHYKLDCTRCICDSGGGNLSCEVEDCEKPQDPPKSEVRSKPNKRSQLISLPELKNLDDKCTPGFKYRHICNTCFCNSNKQAICTSMLCLSDFKLNISDLRRMVNSQRNKVKH